VTNPSTKEFKLSCPGNSGLFSGQVRVSAPGETVSCKGLVLKKEQSACGCFLGTDQNGSVWIGGQ